MPSEVRVTVVWWLCATSLKHLAVQPAARATCAYVELEPSHPLFLKCHRELEPLQPLFLECHRNVRKYGVASVAGNRDLVLAGLGAPQAI